MARTIELEKGEVIAVRFGDVEFLIDSTSDMLTVWTSTEDNSENEGTLFSKTLSEKREDVKIKNCLNCQHEPNWFNSHVAIVHIGICKIDWPTPHGTAQLHINKQAHVEPYFQGVDFKNCPKWKAKA